MECLNHTSPWEEINVEEIIKARDYGWPQGEKCLDIKELMHIWSSLMHRDCDTMQKACTNSIHTKSQYWKIEVDQECYLYVIATGRGKISFLQWRNKGYYPHSRATLMLRLVNQYKLGSMILVLFCSFLERGEGRKRGMSSGRDRNRERWYWMCEDFEGVERGDKKTVPGPVQKLCLWTIPGDSRVRVRNITDYTDIFSSGFMHPLMLIILLALPEPW